jgi:uncharacterized membrane protein YfcA
MLSSNIFSIFVGAALGILAGLGVGGGSLLMLWLTMVLGMDHMDARTINLLFFLPCALTATLIRSRQGVIRLKELLPAIIAGCISTAAGTFLSNHMQLEWIKKLFGGLLIVTGIRELFYRRRKAR